jgi:hypothetical protein
MSQAYYRIMAIQSFNDGEMESSLAYMFLFLCNDSNVELE